MTRGELFRRLRYFLQRDQVSRELEEEMRMHMEMRAESLRRISRSENELLDGPKKLSVNHDLAYVAARKRFGNPTELQQRSQDMWGFASVDELTRDLRFAIRRLVQQRNFSLSVIGVMAIGIGAVTAMFSAVDAALLRPLPFKSPEQLMVLPPFPVPFGPALAQTAGPARQLDITHVREMKNLFSDVAAFGVGGANLVDADQPRRLKVGVVTPNFFATLGINPIRGRAFVESDGTVDIPDAVMLSYGLWQQQYGGRDVAGMHITLGARVYEVVGIMPRGFSFPSESDLWVPLTVPTNFATMDFFRGFANTQTVARLASDVTPDVANAQLLARLEQWQNTLDSRSRGMFKNIIPFARKNGAAKPLQQALVGVKTTALYVLLGATGLLLLIACVNVTNLLLSHANARRRELAVRQVLGATRMRIVRQLLTESVVLAMAGAMLGVLLAPIALRVMRTLLPASLAGVAPAEVNVRVLLFGACTAVITGLVFGLWPAFRSSGGGQSEVIKGGGGHGATSVNAGRVRRVLVSAELALTVMLLIGAGLMQRSFSVLMQRESGLVSEQVGTLEMTLPDNRENRNERIRKLDEILSRLSVMPGVQSAAAVNDLPLSAQGGTSVQITIDGAASLDINDRPGGRYLFATEHYFSALGIKLLRGRSFRVTDDSLAPKTAVISKTMADRYWPNTDPLGQLFHIGSEPITVIGVAADVREASLERDAGPQMYLHLLAGSPTRFSVVARGTLSEQALLARMLDAVRSVDKTQAVYNVRMMDDVVSNSVAPRRTNTLLIGSFAMFALVLVSVGVYAVVSYGVSHRSRELGIRSALGASGTGLVTMLASEMVVVTLAGVVIGLAGAWALAKTLESLVYGVQVHDTVTFILVPVALLVPTALATLIPARRALTVNPSEVMRAD